VDPIAAQPAGLPESRLEREARRSAAALALRTAAEELLAGGGPDITSPADIADWLVGRAALIEADGGFARGSNCRVVE
jgi:hypothetical protein